MADTRLMMAAAATSAPRHRCFWIPHCIRDRPRLLPIGIALLSCARNPANAALSVFEKVGSGISDAIVILARPTLVGDTLTFDVAVVNGSIAGADGLASLFIDTIWFQGGEHISRSKTNGGISPAIGSRSDTSTLEGWSNPPPSRDPPDR
jgi:hypothetical protein